MEKAFPDTFGCRSSGKDDSKNVGSDDVVQAVVGELISPASSSSQATGFSSLVSLFFLFPVPYTRGDVIRSCNIESESLWNLLIKSFEI